MFNDLVTFSDSIVQLIEKAGSGVIQVDARRRQSASGIIWSSDGFLLTANHVVESDDNIKVGLPGNNQIPATLIGRDPTTDLAVLKINAAELTPFEKVTGENVKVGTLVFALGRPGKRIRASMGMVNLVGDSWRTPAGGNIDQYIQTNIEMLPGFSGGALINPEGKLIGLNTSALSRESGLTIPIATLDRVVQSLITHGKIKRGYLGVGTQPVRLPETIWKSLNQETGLLIVSVETGSPAEAGGLLLGDVIIALNNQPIRFMDEFFASLNGDQIGSASEIKILRGGQIQTLKVILGERP